MTTSSKGGGSKRFEARKPPAEDMTGEQTSGDIHPRHAQAAGVSYSSLEAGPIQGASMMQRTFSATVLLPQALAGGARVRMPGTQMLEASHSALTWLTPISDLSHSSKLVLRGGASKAWPQRLK